MKLNEIMQMLDEFCPPGFAMSWDNVGLQVGRSDKEIQTIALALDATSEVIDKAVREGADLILTHHPLLFGPVKKVTDSDHVGKRVLKLAREDIACFAMHTNFDVLGMGDAAADLLKLADREVLEVTFEDDISVEGLGRIGSMIEPMKLSEVAARTAEVFEVENVRYYGDPDEMIVTCAILPGSGHGEIDLAAKCGADVIITGDISHHDGIDAVEKGIAVIDAGHYGVEKIFIPYMKEYLEREMPEIRILSCDMGGPFQNTYRLTSDQ